MTSTTRSDRLQQAHERLTQAVTSIVTGDDWKRMLETAAKFHRYSFNNQLLIFCQRPDATHVAGFNRWRSLGRTVRKGEKGIQILAPLVYKKDASETGAATESLDGKRQDQDPVKVLRGFKIAHVFDISQTDGEPLEDLDAVRPKVLSGEAPEGLWNALVQQAETAGFTIIREQKGTENGCCDFLNKKIAVRPDVEPSQAVKTLVHELGHALLHGEELPTSREVAEVEVESVAYIVCDALGLNSDSYSFPYVARWSGGDVDLIKQSAQRVVSCASSILAGLDLEVAPS